MGGFRWAVAILAAASTVAIPVEFVEENPWGVEVNEVHAVFSNHFDMGCKTPYCGSRTDGEPDRCAYVGHAQRQGEPWAYHIINRYFDQFIPEAIASANAARAINQTYTYMIQPIVVALYFDCENSGMVSWPGSGFEHARTPVLHCPNRSSVDQLKLALKRGDIYMHAFPHDGEASYYPDVNIFEAAFKVAFDIADDLGVPRPSAVSQRDVPGWSRASLPTLNRNGIYGLSFGAGVPPGKPDTPPLFLWKDVASGSEVVTTYETAYGTQNTVFVLPNGVAFAACWDGDNSGPPPLDTANNALDQIRHRYPAAKVTPSTLDAFFAIANKPDVKRLLPIVTSEIGDGWIYGVPSDPLKNAQFRAACRLRLKCITSGKCDPQSAGMKAYDRLLTKIPEHTWGVAQSWFLPDYTNWSNVDFDAARAQQPAGFVLNNTLHADYNTTVNSWIEQRTFVTAGPALLQEDAPDFATELAAELDTIANPVAPSTSGFKAVPPSEITEPMQCGSGHEVQFGSDGSIVKLVADGGKSMASTEHVLGQYRYQSFTDDDYRVFLDDFAIRTGNGCVYQPGAKADAACGNFRKPGVQLGDPKHRDITGTLTDLWRRDTVKGCEFLANVTFPNEAVTLAGSPRAVMINVSVAQNAVEWDVYTLGKRPTRLPESLFFTFNPVAAADKWTLITLNSTLDPTDTFGKNGSVYGGSPHLRGVERVQGGGLAGSFTIESLDVPIVCTGKPTPFPTPRNAPPDMTFGVSYNIFQNIWNTNYVLWYPFSDDDQVTRSRFSLHLSR